MKWASAISDANQPAPAIDEAAAIVRAALGDAKPDLILAFVSAHHHAAFGEVPAALARAFPGAARLGCSAGGVIGAGREIEDNRAVSLIAAHLPNVEVTPFHLEVNDLPGPNAPRGAWERQLGLRSTEEPQFVVLPDPFTFDARALLSGLDAAFPASKKIGGLASGGRARGHTALFLDDNVHRSGAVGVALSGNVEVETIVAQGCRPIGEPMLITRCEQNAILELGQKAPVLVLQELFETLNEDDRKLFQSSLFLGIEMKDQREYHAGDFLIRNILGLDPKSGAIVVGALPEPWQVAQFHLRDAQASAKDLARLLRRHEETGATPHGALLFSCLGRGVHLYEAPDHDSQLFLEHFDHTPLAGFFCNGEIGPVGPTTFLHGYTSAFGLFRART